VLLVSLLLLELLMLLLLQLLALVLVWFDAPAALQKVIGLCEPCRCC
jgi:hypothetical protein